LSGNTQIIEELDRQVSSDRRVEDRVKAKPSFLAKLSYGIGGGAEVLMANLVFVLALAIYSVAIGIDARLIGVAIAVPRLWDAFTDPFMGNISDNTRTRWGRRCPYIFCGAVVTGLLCIVLWLPPIALGNTYVYVYFIVVSMLYFTSYTVFAVPYNALGYELSSDYDQRTSVMAYKTFVGSVVSVLFLSWAYKACFWFGETEVEGVRVVGLIFGFLMTVFGVFPALFCKEYSQSLNQEKIPLVKAFCISLQNKPFMIICGIILFVIVGAFLGMPLQLYLNLAYIFPGDRSAAATFVAYGSFVYGVTGFLSVPAINMHASRYGKKNTLIAGLIFVMLGFLLSWFYFTPSNPYLQLLFGVFASSGMACVWVLTASCIADICDIDDLKTGLRREGMYGAVYSWLMKTGVAGVIAVSGFIISWSGFDSELACQSTESIFRLRLVFAVGPFLFLLIAVCLTHFYPITRQTLNDIQRQLKERELFRAKNN